MRLRLLHEDVEREARMFLEQTGHPPTVAVDLDGTLTKDGGFKGPDEIAKPRKGARKAMQKFRKWGFRVIVFTVRGNHDRIKDWLHEHDIPYDFINYNPDQPLDSSGKIIADIYIDDRGLRADKRWKKLARMAKDLMAFRDA